MKYVLAISDNIMIRDGSGISTTEPYRIPSADVAYYLFMAECPGRREVKFRE
jgi:hypothetical protein